MSATSAHVIDITQANFESEVIQGSMKTPILVDLWATWCGPCKTLGPILEGFAEQYGGAFRLAKIDVDKNPQVAAAFRAQSIPMVVAIYQGRPVNQFGGALPKDNVIEFIDGVLSSCGVEIPEQEPAGAPTDPEAAARHWNEKLEKNPADGEALLELARLAFAADQIADGEALLGKVTASMPQYSDAQTLLKVRELLGEVAAADGEEAIRQRLASAPTDPQARYLVALADGARGHFVTSLEVIVDLVGTAPKDVRDKAKQAASILFDAAGRDNEDVEILRRKLARLLF